jgi:hypothetical protein
MLSDTLLPLVTGASTAASQPAGGAAIGQIIIATAAATVVTLVLLVLCHGFRTGRVRALGDAADYTSRVSGLPGWAALPSAVGAVSLITALFGMYWDISLHIDNGRDPGPLANPAHYFILAGLFGIFSAGVFAMVLPGRNKPGPAAIKISKGWYAPVGAVLMSTSAAFALIGFPLDDVWHRLFGQDVTLWGPTHLMLIGGAGMTLIGQAVLLSEGMSYAREHPDKLPSVKPASPPTGLVARIAEDVLVVLRRLDSHVSESATAYTRRAAVMGGLMIGLSTFQGEFDFGVPQYNEVFQPILLALAAGIGLVAARVWIGRGGAISAVVFFFVVRGILAIIVGPILGETMPAQPLYLVEALCVEGAALLLISRPLVLGAVSGLLIGTVGYAAEDAWTHVVYRLPWNSHLLPAGPIYATIVGVASGLIGAVFALGLKGRLPSRAVSRAIPVLGFGVFTACAVLSFGGAKPDGGSVSATTTVAQAGAHRTLNATFRVTPAKLADDARWVTVTGWQGRGRLHVDRLKRVAPGLYATNRPFPVFGGWKETFRVENGNKVIGIPIFMPLDKAIPAKEVPALAHFTRPFQRDTDILQRERKINIAWLWTAMVLLVVAIYAGFIVALGWGVGRVARAGGMPTDPPRPSSPRREREPAAVRGPSPAGV